jgi:hypothetical protein
MKAFSDLREFVLSLGSAEEAKQRLSEAIGLMAAVNDLYMDVSIDKDEAMLKLQEVAEKGRENQMACEEWIHTCQLKADRNVAVEVDDFTIKGLNLMPLEDWDEEDRPSDQKWAEMTETERVQFRIEHDLRTLPALREHFERVSKEHRDLREKLNTVRKEYSGMLSRMRQMYDDLGGLARKHKIN